MVPITKVKWDKSYSRAKIIGTAISITGGIFVALYKGPVIQGGSTSSYYLQRLRALNTSPTPLLVFTASTDHWALGTLLLASSFFSISVWNIIQSGTLKQYPEVMTVTSFYSLMGTAQCAVVSMIAERDISAWKLELHSELPLIVATACFGSLIRSRVHLWGMRMKGPFYVPMFRPFGIIFATTIALTFFANSLHFGSLLGTLVSGMGYYTVMWGTVREEDERHHGDSAAADEHHSIEDGIESADAKVPLLRDRQDPDV
uniref:WAT1-related protein n=1 Tax=Kalanchoe fedtschenkoi TaxID=63787 RepID=A0A7N0TDY2_KALFE